MIYKKCNWSAISYMNHKYYHHNYLTVTLLLQSRNGFMSTFKSKYQDIDLHIKAKQINLFFSVTLWHLWTLTFSRPSSVGSISKRSMQGICTFSTLGHLPLSPCSHTCLYSPRTVIFNLCAGVLQVAHWYEARILKTCSNWLLS